MKNLKTYIKTTRSMKIEDAAKEIGITRQYLSSIISGKVDCGKKTAQKIEKWSDGLIRATSLLNLE